MQTARRRAPPQPRSRHMIAHTRLAHHRLGRSGDARLALPGVPAQSHWQAPVSVAIDIAEGDDHDVQAALSNAYENGLLKGRKLLAAKKFIETRRRRSSDYFKDCRNSQETIDRSVLAKNWDGD